jgi:hypothetical protein
MRDNPNVIVTLGGHKVRQDCFRGVVLDKYWSYTVRADEAFVHQVGGKLTASGGFMVPSDIVDWYQKLPQGSTCNVQVAPN